MCWSAEVSAAFAAAEWAGILWLVRRNTRFDRPLAIAASPIAAQEVLQWLLWEHISPSLTSCDRVNVIGSFIIREMVGLVPVAWVWFAQREFANRRFARRFLGATIAYVLLRNGFIGYSFWTGPTLCTTIGPGHHQAWPPYLGRYVELQPALDIVLFTLYWSQPVSALLIMLRPRWLAVAMALLAVATMVPCLLLASPDEMGSLWCWSCSALVGLALLVPRVERALSRAS